MKFKKSLFIIILIIALSGAVFNYSAIASFFSMPTRSKGLVGHWTMDDKDGKSTTVIADRTINANDGTMMRPLI